MPRRLKTESMYTTRKKQRGLTMIELLIAVAILAVVTTIGFMGLSGAQKRTRDAQRKRELQTMKVAFEDYYNDHRCYPPTDALEACGTDELSPYLRVVLCDPQTKQPYGYVPLADSCQGYRIYTRLEVTDDEDIIKQGCDGETGCGYPLNPEYNYGVAVGTSVQYTE
jgi:prepilin-type N-terminal cleavage/methylation domain-containing protein